MRRVRAAGDNEKTVLSGRGAGRRRGFSRAAPTPAALLGDRVEGVGLAGSRPPMDAKNGRRVEFHAALSAVSRRDEDADLLTFRPNRPVSCILLTSSRASP